MRRRQPGGGLFIARRYFLSLGRRGALLRYFAFNFRCSKANGIDLTIPKPAAARRLFWRMQSRNFAAYGNASCREQIKQIIFLKKDGTFALDLRFFRHHLEDIAYEWPGGEPVCGSLFSQTLVDMLGPPRTPDAPIEDWHRNLAWATQAVYEDVFFHLLDTLQRRYGHSAVALAGGCAYNSVANGKLRRRTKFKQCYLQSAAGDAGGAIGAAYVVWHRSGGRTAPVTHAFWGPSFAAKDIDALLVQRGVEIAAQVALYSASTTTPNCWM